MAGAAAATCGLRKAPDHEEVACRNAVQLHLRGMLAHGTMLGACRASRRVGDHPPTSAAPHAAIAAALDARLRDRLEEAAGQAQGIW